MLKVGIVGATGYGGAELIRFLIHHPRVKIACLAAKMDGNRVNISDIFPTFKGSIDITCSDLDVDHMAKESDFIFLALPHKVSMELAPKFLKLGKRLVDFSADYRFDDPDLYSQHYRIPHASPELLSEAVYGLPELYREKIKEAHLVANPGCYPTSVILGIAPFLAKGIIEPEGIIVDSKSGVSGAGRWPGESFSFCQIEENFKAYKVASHRHQPEMEQELSKLAGREVKISFTPHLVPMRRGILTTLYLNLKKPVNQNQAIKVYKDFYKNEPFVRVLDSGKLPEIKNVCGTNFCDIGLKVDERVNRVVVISVIDNLVKGASGQAIQNMNVMCGLDERAGLDYPGLIS